MSRMPRQGLAALVMFSVLILSQGGCCTNLREYVRNGFKVGPNYSPAPAPVADHWIDIADLRNQADPATICRWWAVFNDPKLDYLVNCAYHQNLSLKEACFRVLQSRALLAIARGELFPQQQTGFGDYRRVGGAGAPFVNSWDYGFRLQWELDVWGRLRRAVAAADANLDASVADYDNVLVTLVGDVATNYVRIRTDQQRIKLLQANVEIQREVLAYIDKRFRAGYRQTALDWNQALSNLRQTEAGIPLLEIDVRQAQDALCVLLGTPAVDLQGMLGEGAIPTSPPEVALGIPADLLRRRPDVRRAERLAAAQAEEIGIAQADLYPFFTINGTMGYSASNFRDLFKSSAFNGSVGPSFQWNLLNYGRIVNNVRFQDARFQELVAAYQNTVLRADSEVEDGLVTFLQSQRRTRLLDEGAGAAGKAVETAIARYKQGVDNFTVYALIEQNLVTQQDAAAQARGQIAQGLIATYRALGGGWEFRLSGDAAAAGTPEAATQGAPARSEQVPMPLPPVTDPSAGKESVPSPPSPAPPAPAAPTMPLPGDRR
ncbi:MAG: efflux transporter outer membrane subunit [Planctomycetaceae bacterium]|nr:efflux transporter outer membrane subunit [Planctomycetaceae bacterium]